MAPGSLTGDLTALFFLKFIGVQLTYDVALVSGVQAGESVMHISILFSHLGY